jgi:hypothetical protein
MAGNSSGEVHSVLGGRRDSADLGYDLFDWELAEAPPVSKLESCIVSAIQSKTCSHGILMLPDFDPTSQRNARLLSKLVASLLNRVQYKEDAALIIGVGCQCHSRLAQAFEHERKQEHGHEPLYLRPGFRSQIEDCIAEYCDPPLRIHYELQENDAAVYGVAYIYPPLSLPVYTLQVTQDGHKEPKVWIRSEDRAEWTGCRTATSDDLKGLFLEYLRTLQPFLDDPDWDSRQQAFHGSACGSAYGLVCALAGFLLADHPGDREMAVRAFGEVGGLSDSTKVFVAQLLLGMITDEDRGVVHRAIEALARRGGAEQAKFLLSTIDSIPPVEQQLQAIATLGDIGDKEVIGSLRELQERSKELEIGYATDQAVARIRQRFGLRAYDVAKVNRFQACISACDYGLAAGQLSDAGGDICERSTQRRWIGALIQIAESLWGAQHERAKELAVKMRTEGDTPDERFSYWAAKLEKLGLAWNRLHVLYSKIEKQFLNHRFDHFVTSLFSFGEQLLRLVAEEGGIRFESSGGKLDLQWLDQHPGVESDFAARGLNRKQWLTRRALLDLALYVVDSQSDRDAKVEQSTALADLERVLTSLKPLRDRLTHAEQAIDLTTLREHFGSEPKRILATVRLVLTALGPEAVGLNHYDLINSDIRHWLFEAPGEPLRRGLA